MGQELNDVLGRPLCVDMDGTLLRTDVLHEAIWSYLRTNPFRIFLICIWVLRGKSVFKDEIFSRVEIPAGTLPVNEGVQEFVEREKANGRFIALATASHAVIAQQVARELPLFDEVLATDRETNLKGKAKAEALVNRFGTGAFDYIGDSHADVHVWKHCHTAHVVGSFSEYQIPPDVFRGEEFPVFLGSRISAFIRAIRVHQWVKNLLLLVPAVMGHTLLQPQVAQHLLQAFFAFSFTASAVYVLNDLVDVEADRRHHSKRRRPFAAGNMPLWSGAVLVPFLLALALLVSPEVPSFVGVLFGYFALTTLYSFYIKQIVLLDIFTLASLYTVRIFAGSVAAQTVVSPWLLAFSMFLFLSLACVKRASELFNARKTVGGRGVLLGRGYTAGDFDQISRFGSTAGYLAVLVLALYTNSPDVARFYAEEQYLWLICAAILYWISRVWLLASRGQIDEDPIVFALKDPISYWVAALCAATLLAAL